MPKGNGTVHSHDQGVQMNEPFRKAYTIALAISIHHFSEKVKYYKRLHTRERDPFLLLLLFIQQCKDARILCLCILDRRCSILPAAQVYSNRNNMSVCIGITSSKESQKGFGISPECGAGSMTAWKYFFGYCHVPAVKVADFAHKMKRMWNAPVLKTRIGLSKRIMGSTYLLGHFLSVFTQFSQRSLRYEPVTAWHFSFILKRFLKWTSMNRKDFYSIVYHCEINGCDYFSRSSNAWKNASRA